MQAFRLRPSPLPLRLAACSLCLFLLAACGRTRTGADHPDLRASVPSEPIQVMSFNLRLNVASDSADAWPYRREAAAEIIRDADLVGVQEAQPEMLEELRERLPGFSRIGVGRDADRGGEHSAILYRTDRFELLDEGTFWLSETPEVPGSTGWDAALPRIATWGRFRDRQTGTAFLHVNTHFDHVGEEARRESARLLVARTAALAGDLPVLLTGDFNATDDSDVYRTLTEGTGLRDARLATEAPPTGPAATWNAFGSAPLDRRIDLVFVRGPAHVQAFATLDQTIGTVLGTDSARLPSDHYPVVATVTLEAP